MSIDDKTEITDSTTTTATATATATMDEHEKELLVQSENDFKKKQYNSCLKCIEKLLECDSNSTGGGGGGTNTKLLHNKAICEYSLSSYKNANDYKQELESIASMLKISFDDLSSLEDAEYRVLYYNYAIIQFYNKNFNKCLIIIEKIYEFSETLDENLSKEVHLLLIHLYLVTYQPSKALNIIDNYEKQYLNTSTNGDDVKSILVLYKLKAYLQQRSFALCDKEFETLTSKLQSSSSSVSLNSLYLKSYHECMLKNYRKSLEYLCSISKHITPQTSSPSTSEQLLLANKILLNNNISYVYYYTKKFNLSSMFLRRALQDNNKLLNDLKAALSSQTTKATSQQQQLNNLYVRNLNYKCELLYNLGVALLFQKQPLQAFECFSEILKSTFRYSTNVRMWLRLAECCTMTYQQNEDLFKFNEKIKCVQKSIGMHIYHKIVFSTRLSKATRAEQQDTPSATLDFAYICLKNALYLLNNVKIEDESSATVINCCSPSLAITINEFNRLKCSVLVSLAYVTVCLNDYLSTIKYCNMLLNDCKHFISKGNKFLAHNYLAEALLYIDKIGESIENLNSTLDPKSPIDLSFVADTSSSADERSSEGTTNLYDWFPSDVNIARGVVAHNLSIAHAVRGEIELAKMHFFDSVRSFDKQQPASIYYMKIYLDLIEGNRQSLQEVLREHFGNTTLNRTYQPYSNNIQSATTVKPTASVTPSTTTNSSMPTPPPPQQQLQQPQITTTANTNANALQQLLSQQQQQQQLPPHLLQTQLLQLAQQQQYLSQLAALQNPSSPFNLAAAAAQSFHLAASAGVPQSTATPGSHMNALNFSSNSVNQLFQQQAQAQQQQQQQQQQANANNSNSATTASFLSALQSRIS